MNTGEPKAVVRMVHGELVLEDPDTVEFFRSVAKLNCRNTLDLNTDCVEHFKNRMSDRGLSAP